MSASLFLAGDFPLHSGGRSHFKIDCDALTDADLAALAEWAVPLVAPFGELVPVPRGGVRFAEALSEYATEGPRLLVDDVLTTGHSLMDLYEPGDKAIVIFARGPIPAGWVRSLFTAAHVPNSQTRRAA